MRTAGAELVDELSEALTGEHDDERWRDWSRWAMAVLTPGLLGDIWTAVVEIRR